ncbi:DUF4012 domain-containing protein [Gordonia otitidis]|uniref:DUF4012 domain-containing protein n=1 Tax=Gordonia otitidis TaxID=249058 RepID=UPI001D15ACF9|nr:DUF4012 domain-containing protein [Gordonia otitidis]UEA57829.1 DUF4012 domain-containing protein [Gordonia otitidis]
MVRNPTDSSTSDNGRDTQSAGRGRRIAIGAVVVVILIVALAAYLAYLVFDVKSSVEEARSHAAAAKSAIMDGNVAKAQSAAGDADAAARDARDTSGNPVWSAVAAIPGLGSPLKSVHEMAESVADLTSQVLVPSAELADTISPSKLREDGNAVNLQPLAAAQPKLEGIAGNATRIDDHVQHISGSWLGPVSDAREQLVDQVGETARFVQGTNVAAKIAPGMLGLYGPRNYFLAMQTPSESRATGGLVGGFAILRADDGRISAPQLGQNSDLEDPRTRQVDFGSDYNALYDWTRPYTDFRNSNISPNFPDTARIWIANWKEQTGQQLDGAVALDPIALSYVLKVTGPVTLADGEKITADNVVPITLSTSYERFADNNTARKLYLQAISKAVIDQIGTMRGNSGALLEALGHGVQERRIMVYSTHKQEQEVLETTALGHQLPDSSAPFMDVTVGNIAGNKIDYYLRREISYTAGECSGDTRDSTATIKLTNTLTDLSLPDYVIGVLGNPQEKVDKGTNLANVQFTLTKGATIKELKVDGAPALYSEGQLYGHPVVYTQVPIPAGKSVEVTVTATEPTSAQGEAAVPVQPLVDNPTPKVDVPVCGG